MSNSSSVRGTILSSSPCSVPEALALLQKFLASETVPESNLVRGYLVSVIEALEELAASHTPKRKEKSGKKKKGVDTTTDDPKPLEETPRVHLQVWESPETANRSKDSSRRSRKKKNLDTAEDPETLAEYPGVQVRDSAEFVEPLQNSSKRSRKRSLDTASEDPKPSGETSEVQLQAGKSKEPAEPLENGSKRSRTRKNHDSAPKDSKTLAEDPGLQASELVEPLENGIKHGSHSKSKRHGIEVDLSADDHVKHPSKKRHRVSESSPNEDNAGKSSSARSEAPGRSGGKDALVQNRSGIKIDDNHGAAQTGAGPVDMENQVSMEGFSLRTRDPDDLRNDGLDGTKGSSSRSKGSAGKGSHSKNHHSAAAELEDRTPSGGRHKRKRDPGSDEKSVDVEKKSLSKQKGHADGAETSEPEAPRESRLENHISKKTKTKKNVETMRPEGNQTSEKKHSHKNKN